MNGFTEVRQSSYSLPMVWMNLLWGMCGALAMDGLDVSNHVRQRHCFPWRDPETNAPLWRTEYIVMVIINACVGALVSAGMALTDPHGISPWVAIGLGAGGMTTLQKAAGHIPLTGTATGKDVPTPQAAHVRSAAEHNAAHQRADVQGGPATGPRPSDHQLGRATGAVHGQASTHLETEGE